MRHHLVVLHKHYLDLLLVGRKRIECRLSSVRRPPFRVAATGDLLWLKLPSGPVRAIATVADCLFRELHHPGDLAKLAGEHGDRVCAADGFFEEAAAWARFCSLMKIGTVLAVRPMWVVKSDKRAWVLLDGPPRPGMRIVSGHRGTTGRP